MNKKIYTAIFYYPNADQIVLLDFEEIFYYIDWPESILKNRYNDPCYCTLIDVFEKE